MRNSRSKRKHNHNHVLPPKGWGSTKMAAEYAGVSPRVMSNWVKNEGLPRTEVSRKTKLIRYQDIDEFLVGRQGECIDLNKLAEEAMSKI